MIIIVNLYLKNIDQQVDTAKIIKILKEFAILLYLVI